MKVNMDNLRRQMTITLNQVCKELTVQLPNMMHSDQDNLMTAFNALAMHVANLNLIRSDGDAMFNDVSHELVVNYLKQ